MPRRGQFAISLWRKDSNQLDAFIARRPVNCSLVNFDPYGRVVATCSVGGTDLVECLVRKGLALDWPQYSKHRYDGAQRDAEHAGRGLWKGSTLSRGSIVPASAQTESPPIVLTTRMPILDELQCEASIHSER
ncbi:thermonuclease family protein [Bradyrhizobium jicamae]|uniref:thermonuclease family protein n=1 Tax=Bradyrhizobium jicamae TaxID=280332 RepID=UPI001FD96E53|nr:thermonuclease family protein [Bradyrhizobium jicamae]